jgi:hypothetical protein
MELFYTLLGLFVIIGQVFGIVLVFKHMDIGFYSKWRYVTTAIAMILCILALIRFSM